MIGMYSVVHKCWLINGNTKRDERYVRRSDGVPSGFILIDYLII